MLHGPVSSTSGLARMSASTNTTHRGVTTTHVVINTMCTFGFNRNSHLCHFRHHNFAIIRLNKKKTEKFHVYIYVVKSETKTTLY